MIQKGNPGSRKETCQLVQDKGNQSEAGGRPIGTPGAPQGMAATDPESLEGNAILRSCLTSQSDLDMR